MLNTFLFGILAGLILSYLYEKYLFYYLLIISGINIIYLGLTKKQYKIVKNKKNNISNENKKNEDKKFENIEVFNGDNEIYDEEKEIDGDEK